MAWPEIDLEARMWTLPGARTKNGKTHRVPLGPAAVTILKSIPRMHKVELVFPAMGNANNPASGVSKAKSRVDQAMLKSLKEVDADATVPDWRLHDLRRTFASGCRRAGVPLDVVEKLLNHSSGSFAGIVGVYQLHDYDAEKFEAVAAWDKAVTEILGATNRQQKKATALSVVRTFGTTHGID